MLAKPKSEFGRNVLVLLTGTTVAQAIPIAISPILTRIYTPEDFGVLALFLAITAIFGSISSGRYELAIMLPERDEDAINIFALGTIINLAISTILLLAVVLFHQNIVSLTGNAEIGKWLYFVPISVFLTGFYNNLTYFSTRKKFYKDVANSVILKAIILAIFQLSIGLLKTGAAGLVGGNIVSQFFANTKLLQNVVKDKNLLSAISRSEIKAHARKYRNFPKYSIWAALANTLSKNLTNLLISLFYGVATLGHYSIVQRVLGMPSALIGGAIGQVFFQQASIEKKETGCAAKSFDGTVKRLVVIGLPVFTGLFFFVEDIFAFAFGEQWRIAGTYAQLLVPYFFANFVVGTVSQINAVFEKQAYGLYLNLLLLFVSMSTIYVSHNSLVPFQYYLIGYTVCMSLTYTAIFFYFRSVSRGRM